MSMALVANYMKRLKYILQHRYLFKTLAVVVIILTIVYTKTIDKQSIYKYETNFVGTIYKLKVTDNKTTIYINARERLVIEYYQQLKNDLHLGDTISVDGTLLTPTKNTIQNQFNYRAYLYNNDIFYIVRADYIIKIANNTNVIYYVRELIQKRITRISKESAYLQIFLLGDTSNLDDNMLASYRMNGLSHLFSISGMHISLFATIILFIVKKISYSNYYNYTVVIIFLIFYSLLVGNTPSVTRSLTMYILFAINKCLNLKIKKIDLMCIVLIIVLLIHPFYIYNISFQYSYTVSFSLILFNYKIKKIKNSLLKLLYMSFIAFFVTFPITAYYFYQVNLLSIIFNLLYIPLVSSIIFPLALITFIIPKVSRILILFINIMESLSNFISRHQIGIISFPKPNIVMVIIYYFLIYLFIYNYKYWYIILLIVIHKNMIYFDKTLMVSFLDVNQGDSIFIKYPYAKYTILVDTGGNPNSDYELIKNKTIPYFKSLGITKIDYLILTHGDYDHMGEAINLVNSFKVEKVIFNCGPYNDLEQELIKALDKKKIKYYSCIKELNIDNNKLYFLQTKEYSNENDNSNVIYTELNGYKFMFMGDASSVTEHEILSKYNLPDIDVLKVGHHGSKTSSSEEFINEINPKYSIISVGKNNRYGHPSKEVLNNLENSQIYRTDQDGSVMFKIKNNKLKIETFSP